MPVTPRQTIRNVVFDLGNVLIEWRLWDALHRVFPDEQAMFAALEAQGFEAWNLEQDRGRRLAEAVPPGAHPLFAEYAARITDAHAVAIPATVEILRRLKGQGVPCYALSNMSHEASAFMRAHHPFMSWFDGVVISAEEGVVKPDPAIYRLTARRYDLSPAETLFIDDRPDNIAAAMAEGWDGILFTSPEALRDELAARGLWGDEGAV
ncbi:MAG: HAD family phosphatase [Paracoccus sp. (in: a-proteobacteria)]|nr:HAD family phosphatase [Paracoccus sp. (in: a-proteobacteria)]